MLIKDVIKLSPMERFLYFVNEREGVRYGKERLCTPKPWTDDEILQQYKFCNVRRMDDRVSQWLMNNWYTPHFDHPNMLVAASLARHFNLPGALRDITPHVFGKYCPKSIKEYMRARKASGLTIFNGAYMVRGIGTADKTEMVVDNVVQPLVDKPPKLDTNSMQNSVEALLPYWGFSSFMAGQVVADLRWATKGGWRDRRVWAPMGPGSKRGMNRLLGNDKNAPMSQESFLEDLLKLIEHCEKILPGLTQMEAIDWQNCCCEYDKYVRCLQGEGRPKQRYQGV
jgi:hypothetical protein